MFCKKCGKEIQEGTAYCPKCGTPIRRGYIEGFQTSGQQQYGLSMTWYQFVTSLGIWLSAVVYAVFAIRTFLGSAYIEQMIDMIRKAGASAGDIAEVKSEFSAFILWRYAPVIGVIDVLAIIFYIVLVAMAIKVRTQLMMYKANAPQALNNFIVVSAVVYFVHSLLRQFAVSSINLVNAPGSFNFMTLALIGLIGALVVAFLNKTYFAKRSQLFTH